MKKISIILLLSIATFFSSYAQKAHDVVSVNDIFRAISYRYITLKNENRDATALIKYYTPIFKAYGYKHELPGDGYGGPCSIIDGFYKGGYINKKKYNTFVPTRKKSASVIFMSACNDGEDSDYGYMKVTLTVYDAVLAENVFADIEASGFKPYDNDGPEGVSELQLFTKGKQQVRYDFNEEEKCHNFYFQLAD